MSLPLPIGFSELRFFLANLWSKYFILLTKSYYVLKDKFSDLVLLLDYLQNYTVESFPSYLVTELPVTNYVIVKYGLQAWVLGLGQKYMFAFQ